MSARRLNWVSKCLEGVGYYEATLHDFAGDDGVRFSLVCQPTCHRRGTWKLLIEVSEGKFEWGCFDDADQPMRYYHQLENAMSEAECIARALWEGRFPDEKEVKR